MSASMPLAQKKRELKDRLIKDIGLTLQDLKHLVRTPTTYNLLIELEAQLLEANRSIHSGTLSFEQCQLLYPRLRKDVLAFIDNLTEADLQAVGKHRSDKKANQGSILYRIPSVMQLQQETRCTVRLAYLEQYLLDNIDLDEDTKIKTIRVSEIMEVRIQDPSESAAFAIRALTAEESFLDEDDYTEWLFAVKPIREGMYPLMLKVVVVEERRGKERKREIVLEENIEIVSVAPATEETFKMSPHLLTKAVQGNARGASCFDLSTPRFFSRTTPRSFEEATYKKALIAKQIKDYAVYLDKYPNKNKERITEIEALYAKEVLRIASLKNDIAPLTTFIKKYAYTAPTFIADAKESILAISKTTTNAVQLQEALIVFDRLSENTKPDPVFRNQLKIAIQQIQEVKTE